MGFGEGARGGGAGSRHSQLRSSVALVSSASGGEKKHRADPTEKEYTTAIEMDELFFDALNNCALKTNVWSKRSAA